MEYDEGDLSLSDVSDEEEEEEYVSRAAASQRRQSRKMSRRLSRSGTSVGTKDKILNNNEILEDLQEENQKLLAALEAQEAENARLGVTAKKTKACTIF